MSSAPRHAWMLLALGVVACGDGGGGSVSPDAGPADVPADRAALDRAGPYPVGYHHASFTYRPAGRSQDRTIPVELWYPAVAGTGDPTVYQVAGFLQVAREGPRTDAAVRAEGRFPVVLYSHGYSGVGLAGYSYGEYFASWGFVVAAPDHTGNTVLSRSNDITLNYLLRPQDLSATLDWVTGDAASPVKGRTSADIAAIGHSFGGYTVLALAQGARGNWDAAAAGCASAEPTNCETIADPAVRAKLDAGFADPRIEAVVAQTPVILTFAPSGLASLERPVMMMTARRDQTLPWATNGGPGWALLHGAKDTWIDLSNSGHYSMVAVCEAVSPTLLTSVGLDVIPDGCGPDFTPLGEIVPAITAYAHAFIRLHVLGETRWAAVIAGPPFHPTATVTVGH